MKTRTARLFAGLAMAAGLAVSLTSSLPTAKAADGLPDKLSMGALLPLTGNAGFIGEEIRQGLEYYLADYAKTRAAAGLPELNFAFVDSQADPRVGFQGYQLLRSKHDAQLVLLTYTSVGIAVAPAANKDKIPMVNVTQGEVTKLGPLFTSILPAYSVQAEIVIKEAMSRGGKTISLLYENNEAFVVQAKAIQEDVCVRLGCKVVAAEQIPSGSTDVAAQVTAALAPKPDIVFPIGIAPQLVPIARELQTRGYKGMVIGLSDLGGVVTTGNGKLIEGALLVNFAFDENNADFKRLTEMYRAKYNKEPTQYVYMGYQGGQVIAETLKIMKANKTSWSGENFVAAQKSGSMSTVSGPVSFLKDGRIDEQMMLMTVKDGKFVPQKKVSLH
jgi:ABC-type branched-subunit amino acid transport system substrate-binding protein